jgi:hypothetical protein
MKKHNPWFHERCSELLDKRKQDKLQWVQDQSKINRIILTTTGLKPAGITGKKEGIF